MQSLSRIYHETSKKVNTFYRKLNIERVLVPIDAPLMIGMEEPPALNRYYNGVIDEFALFNRGLSQDEVKEIQESSIQEILAVEPDEKLPTTWGVLKGRYAGSSKSN